jgi:putative transposase
MKRRKFTDEQILAIVKEGEAGRKIADLCRAHGMAEQTFYRWKKQFAGLGVQELRELRSVRDENRKLKEVVAELTLDRHIL